MTPLISLPEISDITNNQIGAGQINIYDATLTPARISDSPQSSNSLIIAIVTEGEGTIGIDLKEYSLKKDYLIVIQPRNYFWFKKPYHDVKIRILACSRQLIETVVPKLSDLLPLLIQHRSEPVVKLSETETTTVLEYLQFIRHRLNEPTGALRKNIISSLLQSLFFYMLDQRCQNSETGRLQRTRKEEIMAKFIIEVSEHFRENRQVNFYADRLCITSKHLSTIIKSITGMTAGEWIDNYVILEAKILLRTTDHTIQQISQELNFKDQSIFGKYFKHITGQTPSTYRHTPF